MQFVSNDIRQQSQIIEKNRTNLNITALCTVMFRIKMIVNVTAELYYSNNYTQ
jgi:hypothetical protein